MTPDNVRGHVLAVNDEPALLELYADILEEEGFRVTTQLLPMTEPATVAAIAPDVIVLDLLVGRLDWGTTFLGLLRTDPATRGLPVVVCTAAEELVKDLAPQLAEWGVTVIAKPFDIDAFVDVVRSTLDPRAGERS